MHLRSIWSTCEMASGLERGLLSVIQIGLQVLSVKENLWTLVLGMVLDGRAFMLHVAVVLQFCAHSYH